MTDTIIAMSTAQGVGLRSIIRLSGPNTFRVVNKVFNLKLNKRKFKPYSVKTFNDMKIYKDLSIPLTLYIMKAPYSYTKEDVIEFHITGFQMVADILINKLLKTDLVRIAEPGEYTKRAFFNGRIDLSRAESVMDVINAGSIKIHDLAVQNIRGMLSEKINYLSTKLTNLLADIEAGLDFAEEDISFVTQSQISDILNSSINEIKQLRSSSVLNKFSSLVKLFLVGIPNAGKSSLFNILSTKRKNIVTNIPGTTRDVLETELVINDLFINLYDSAGISFDKSKSLNLIETGAKDILLKLLNLADLLLVVIDSSNFAQFKQNYTKIKELIGNTNSILVLNKIDKITYQKRCSLVKVLSNEFNRPIVQISCKSLEGISKLKKEIFEILTSSGGTFNEDSIMINNRQLSMLKKAEKALKDAMKSLKLMQSDEFLVPDIREAIESLQLITGNTFSPDILDNIFSRFCIGK